jgi:hypothetical protein
MRLDRFRYLRPSQGSADGSSMIAIRSPAQIDDDDPSMVLRWKIARAG